ncbi:MAG: CsgG/HfaB family protein [Treponema sp.]|jgi:hypothetical protein|nr:CsgG/HfaB family protein [Treponema sp.]
MKISHYYIGLLACLCIFNAACSSVPELVVSETAPVLVIAPQAPPEPEPEVAPVEVLVALEPEPVVVEPLSEPSIGFTLEAALRRSCDTLIETLPDTSSIALISIASDNLRESEFAVKELSVLLLDSRIFSLVERRTLDPIIRERRFQLTGEVDDTSALSIGHRTGAEIVMTGVISIHESEKYLRLRAIDVESEEILALTSEPFID